MTEILVCNKPTSPRGPKGVPMQGKHCFTAFYVDENGKPKSRTSPYFPSRQGMGPNYRARFVNELTSDGFEVKIVPHTEFLSRLGNAIAESN